MANSKFGRFLVGRLFGLVVVIGLAGTALGCGDDGSSLSEFVGTWKYTNTAVVFSCPNQADQSILLGVQKTLRLGVKSDLVDLSSTCDYRFDVNDKVASIQQGQTCDFDDGQGGTATESPTSWTFTLNSAVTAEEKLTTKASFIDGTDCTISGVAHLERISKD